MKLIGICLHFCLFSYTALAQLPAVSSGTIKRLENFTSQYVEARNIDIWLPEGYNPALKYNVLYMHDGQMLFDSNTTWNHQTWNADDVAAKLIKTERVHGFIVVGVWNAGQSRHRNYFPQKPYDAMTKKQKKAVTRQLQKAGRTKEAFQPDSDNYLKFLVFELKPFIDKNYAVFTEKAQTFIAGSSMGGLISMYAICEYPEVFGGAACMSTHWPGIFTVKNNPVPNAFYQYMEQHLPNPATHRIYFDYGDQTLDALYPPLQQKVDAIMTTKGYTATNWVTHFFPGDDHSEKSWNRRLEVPFYFLMKK